MRNLPDEVKKLINLGHYSLYTVVGHDFYWLHVPAAMPCCSLYPHPQSNWKVDKDGNVVEQLPEVPGFQPGELIRFIPLEEES